MRHFFGMEWGMTRRSRSGLPEEEKDPFLVAIGERIHTERRLRRLTQKEIAEECGVQPSTVWAAEAGAANISVKTLAGIAKAMGLSMSDLLPGGERVKSVEHLARANKALTDIVQKLEVATKDLEELRQRVAEMQAEAEAAERSLREP